MFIRPTSNLTRVFGLIALTLAFSANAYAADYVTAIKNHPDLVGYWRFEDTTPGAPILSEPNLPATSNGFWGATGDPTWIGGGIGSSSFGASSIGNTAFATIYHDPSLELAKGTIMFWFQAPPTPTPPTTLADLGKTTMLFQKGQVLGGCTWTFTCPRVEVFWTYTDGTYAEDTIRVHWNDGVTEVTFDLLDVGIREQAAPHSVWHHLALTFDSTHADGDIKIYLNGFLRGTYRAVISSQTGTTDATQNIPISLVHPSDPSKNNMATMRLGAHKVLGGGGFTSDDVAYDELAIFGEPLPQNQIQALLEAEWGTGSFNSLYLSNNQAERIDGQRFASADVHIWSRNLSKKFGGGAGGTGNGRYTGYGFIGELQHNTAVEKSVDALHIDFSDPDAPIYYMSTKAGANWLRYDGSNNPSSWSAEDGDIVRFDPMTAEAFVIFCEKAARGGTTGPGSDVHAFSIKPNGNWLLTYPGPETFYSDNGTQSRLLERGHLIEIIPDPAALTSTNTYCGIGTLGNYLWNGLLMDVKDMFGGTPNLSAVHALTDDVFLFSMAAGSVQYQPPLGSSEKVRDGDIVIYQMTTKGDIATIAAGGAVTPPVGQLIGHDEDPNLPFPYYFSEDFYETGEDVNAIAMNYGPRIFGGFDITPIGTPDGVPSHTDSALYCEPKQFRVRAYEIDGTTLWTGALPAQMNAILFAAESGSGLGDWDVISGGSGSLVKLGFGNTLGDGLDYFVRGDITEPFDYMIELRYLGNDTSTTGPATTDFRTASVSPIDASDPSIRLTAYQATAPIGWSPATFVFSQDYAYDGTNIANHEPMKAGNDPNGGADIYLTAWGSPAGNPAGSCEVIEAFEGDALFFASTEPMDPNPAQGQGVSLASSSGGVIGTVGAALTPIPGAMFIQFTDGISEPVSFKYADVGQFKLNLAEAQGSVTPLNGLDWDMTAATYNPRFYPPKVRITRVESMTGVPAPLSASCSTGSKFIKAGETFRAYVSLSDDANSPLPGFGSESIPQTITMVSAGIASPSLGNDPNLGVGATSYVGPGTDFRVDNMQWAEAGSFYLRAEIQDYMGWGVSDSLTDTLSSTVEVGRFYPDQFQYSTDINPLIEAQCLEDTNTAAIIMGVPLSTVSNGGGLEAIALSVGLPAMPQAVPLLNYSYAECNKMTESSLNLSWSDPVNANFTDPNGLLSLTPTVSLLDANTGVFEVRVAITGTNDLRYTRPLPPSALPMAASAMQMHMTLRDTDGVMETVLGLPVPVPRSIPAQFDVPGQPPVANANVHYARIRMGTGHGDERLPIDVPIYLESWRGANSGWQNIQSSNTGTCSTAVISRALDPPLPASPPSNGVIDAPLAEDTHFYLIERDPADPNAIKAAFRTGNQLLPSADTTHMWIRFPSPGVGKSGTLEFVMDAGNGSFTGIYDWDWPDPDNPGVPTLNPRGSARFGVYKREDEVIFIREMY